MRRGHAKVLREEWYPIARVALHLKQPGLDIDVEAFGSNGPADGHIVERGFREREFDVQVTYAFDYKDSLRSEHMVRHGSVPGTGAIVRDKKSGSIVAEVAAVDADYNVQKAATEIAERFRKKAAKPARCGTALIIAFEDMTLRGYYAWRSLLSLVENQVDLGSSPFQAVYVVNCGTGEVQQVA